MMTLRLTSRQKAYAILMACFCVFGLLFATGVSAQTTSQLGVAETGIQYGEYTGLSGTDIRITIANIIRVALGLLGTIALLLILYAGFLWMTAAGSEDRILRAKKTMSGAVIGLVIIISAFAIVSFVMSSLIESTTGGGGAGSGGGGGGPGGGGFGGGGSGFRPTAIQPEGAVDKRDVVAAITFSSAPTGDVSNIRANVTLEKIEGGSRTAVDYTPTVTNNVIRLVPDEACPDPNGDRNCLDANSDFIVNILSGLKNASTSNPLTVNCGFTAVCSQEFSTGEEVGTEPPTVSISNPTNGQSVPIGELVQVQTLLSDEYGIASVDYFSGGSFIASDGAVVDLGGGSYTSQTFWDTTSEVPGQSVALGATAFNIDGDSTDAFSVNVVPRPAHCFNGVEDVDETGPDCGGADCGSCTGSSCSVDGDCASGQCIEGQCVTTPKILDVQARNGAPGNIITITGTNLGGGVGTIAFLGDVSDDSDDVNAQIAQCSGAWGDDRVFVVVPSGASTGPIRVTTSVGKTDATNDTFGPIIPDFVVNDVSRPGICGIDPFQAKAGQTLSVSGEGFGDSQGASRVEFAVADAGCIQAQSFAEGADAGLVDPWSADLVQPTLPNLDHGTTGQNYLVRVTVGGENSNTACMRVLPPSAGSLPRIDFVSPTSGSAGTYMTVFGGNFGAFGTVRFSNSAGEAVGDVDFPAQCSVDFWNEDSVTVKVPDEFTTPTDTAIDLGTYDVTVLRNDGQRSNAVSFTVDSASTPPGICRISPDNGPEGTPVTLFGEGFGAAGTGDLEALVTAHPDAVLFSDNVAITTLSQWNPGAVGTVVPEGSQTGSVAIRKYSGSEFTQSNGINFQVRDCRVSGGDASCGAGETCCGNGSCSADCADTLNRGGYGWMFSTGPIPVFPVVLEDATCRIAKAPDEVTVTPSPSPFRNQQDVCTDIAGIALRFSLPMDAGTFNSETVILERCGTGERLGLCEPVPPGTVGAPSVTTIELDTQGMLSIPVSGMEASTWYRLTITDSVTSLSGDGRSAQPLDGDFDSQRGGSYVTRFKTGEDDCVVSGVDVTPDRGLIDSADGDRPYDAAPISSSCIKLSCEGRTVAWKSTDTSKATVGAGGLAACTTTALPVEETDPGPDIGVQAEIDGFFDTGALKIDYANPRVVEFGPANCTEACVNTLPYAVFNTDMADFGPGSVTLNARLQECVNESCLAFVRTVGGTILYDGDAKTLSFEHAGLAANTFYRVTIEGDALSSSGAPLTGLNFNDSAFSWIFRTRTDGNPCGPQDIAISPQQTTLNFIGERASVNAIPKTSPDACSDDGQRLTANSFEWGWDRSWAPESNPEVFDLLPDHPTVLSRTISPSPGCSSSCLATGSYPPNTSECGNGILERGEACETPGIGGCTDRCLLTGNADNGEGGSCGDGVTDPSLGEACDAGAENGSDESGCSVTCLFSGSTRGLSQCGNGSQGVGEACDDGNTQSGDGCSSSCTLEGSDQNVPVCGNGILDTPYEQCDYVLVDGTVTELLHIGGSIGGAELAAAGATDPNVPGFPCTSSCLFSGNTVRTDAPGACGDGVIDYAEGENCDAGSENGILGSGCSSRCLKTGEDIVLGAFCKDGEVTVKAPDGDAQNGGGEDCEPEGANTIVSPKQVVEARNQCDAGNSCDASVIANIGTVTGEGSINVECSCRDDSDCSTFGSGLACGAGACCFQRPEPPVINPTGFDECRNVAVTIAFPVEMDVGSLTTNITVEACGATVRAENQGNLLVRAFRAIGRFFRSLIGADASAQSCSNITGTFEHAAISSGGEVHTESRFSPDEIYLPGTTYRVTVETGADGVRGVNGVGYPESEVIVQEFGTGEEICSFDVLQVEPSSLLIQTSDDVHGFVARSMTNREGILEEIAPVPGVYDWTYVWNTVAVGGGDTNLNFSPPSPGGPSAGIQAATGVNGKETLFARATISNDGFFQPSTVGQEKVGKADITVFLCENPWPSRDIVTGEWSPYLDPDTHFEMYYCRDSTSGDLLPELQVMSNLRSGETFLEPVYGQSGFRTDLLGFCENTLEDGQFKSCSSDSQCAGGDTCRTKDAFFRFRPEARLNDAIGVRVAPNINHLSPQRWYEDRQFSGRTEALQVDGYNAVKDERTVYISAADKYGDPQLRSYVYVLGFNDGADARTVGIFDQLIENMSFNTNIVGSDEVTNVCRDGAGEIVSDDDDDVYPCSSDLECLAEVPGAAADVHCDADKDKLRRDMQRWEQLHTMTEELEAIRTSTGFYPRLESGTFIRGMTTSAWPSWSELGGAAVQDPLNTFNRCASFGSLCAITKASCSSDADCDQEVVGDVCEPKYEDSTCYNASAGLFMCPQGSRVYRYQAIGGIDYRIQAEFEFTDHPWGGACEDQTDRFSCETKVGCVFDDLASACRSRISFGPSCTGVFTGNACLISRTVDGNPVPCDTTADCDTSNPADTCQPAGVTLFGTTVPGSEICGNGIVEGSEACEIGQVQTLSCATGGFRTEICRNDCSGYDITLGCPGAPQCGNGFIERGDGTPLQAESCDDGSQNGQYGRCRNLELGCRRYCVNITKREAFDPVNDINNSFVCTSNAQCGANEICTDRYSFCGDGVKNGPEACDDGADNGDYGRCAWDCSGPGPRCGDNTVNGGEQCDGNSVNSPGICVTTTVPDDASFDGTATACESDNDCGAGETCALCAPTTGDGLNDPGGLPQTRSKNCQLPTAGENACTFANWSVCKPSGACGNGVVEGNEQCDEGASNSVTGSCLPTCRVNVCNDGFVHEGIEQCDEGVQNGVLCDPEYGLTCNYCKNDCTIETISGAYCGDNIIQNPPSGPENCDPGRLPAWCSKTYQDPADSSNAKGCFTTNDCAPGVCRNYVNEEDILPRIPHCHENERFARAEQDNRLSESLRGILSGVMIPVLDHLTPGFGSAFDLASQAFHEPDWPECIPTPENINPPGEEGEYCNITSCRCDPGFFFDEETLRCLPEGVTFSPEGAECNDYSDCAGGQYCEGGEGVCIAFGNLCIPDPYSNAQDPASPHFINGSCAVCSNLCVGEVVESPFFCGDDIVQAHFGEQCEGVEGDALATVSQGTFYGCAADCRFDPESGYCGDGIIQADQGELCDQGPELGCISDRIPNPNLYLKVDMVFAVDISGSMQGHIDNISDAILSFVGSYEGSDHRFGLVVFTQSGGPPIETDGPNGRRVIDLTDVATFQSVFSDLVTGPGGTEPMYDAMYELADARNAFNMNWRDSAHPHIVIVTDESAPAGNFSSEDEGWRSEAEVRDKVTNCEIGSCADDPEKRVETFVIAPAGNFFYDQWESIIYGERSDRYIDLGGDVQYYINQLDQKTFANVCKVDDSPVTGVTVDRGPSEVVAF